MTGKWSQTPDPLLMPSRAQFEALHGRELSCEELLTQSLTNRAPISNDAVELQRGG
jgi:hypothetical protein